MPAPSAALLEKRQQFAAKQKELGEVFEMAKDGDVYDLSRKNVLEKLGATDQIDAAAKLKARNVELDDLGAQLQQAELKEIDESRRARDDARNVPMRGGNLPSEPIEDKSFGQMVVEHKAYTEHWKGRSAKEAMQRGVVIEADIGLKTLMQTTAGWAPRPPRIDRVVDFAIRPVQILDLIPIDPTDQPAILYMEETTRTQAAAEIAESGTYQEDAFVFTERTSTVRKIGSEIPVTDEQLEDVGQVRGILDNRLRFGVRARLDSQVLGGNGTPPNLAGILNTAGIQTQAKASDPVFDAVLKAITKARITGRSNPNAIIMHPTDWQNTRLMRTADGIYILGNPSEPGPTMLFGLPVAISDALTLGTALTGDFQVYCQLWEKRGVQVSLGFINDQFIKGQVTLRADTRVAFVVYRPAAFCSITGL